MKKTWLVLMLGVSTVAACAAGSNGLVGERWPIDRPFNYESVDVADANVAYQRGEDISVSTFGYNPRRWEPAEFVDFQYPIAWLNAPADLAEQIYVAKQVGKSTVFCLIRPRADNYKERRAAAEYIVFVAIAHRVDTDFSWTRFLRAELGEYDNYREIEAGRYSLVQANWQSDHYWSAPTGYWRSGDKVYEIVLVYRGASRTYANQIMNKFPWRAFSAGE